MDEIAKQVGMGIATSAVGVVKYDAMEFVIRKSAGASAGAIAAVAATHHTLPRIRVGASKGIGLRFG